MGAAGSGADELSGWAGEESLVLQVYRLYRERNALVHYVSFRDGCASAMVHGRDG